MGKVIAPCFKCGREFEPAGADGGVQPYGGTMFTSHGNYGSTVWDDLTPFGGPDRHLLVLLCDHCVREAADAGRVVLSTARTQPTTWEHAPWRPEPDEGYQCKFCPESFVTREGRRIHRVIEHDQVSDAAAVSGAQKLRQISRDSQNPITDEGERE